MKHLFKYFKNYKKEVILAPTFKLLEALLELLIPLIVASIIDTGIKNNDVVYIIKMVLLMIGLGLVGLILSLIGQFFSAKAAVGFSTKLRSDLFKKIQELTFSQIDQIGTASLITKMTNDVNQMQTGINLTLRLFLRSPFVVFGAAIMASILVPELSYIFFITIGVLSIIVFGIILLTLPMYKKTGEHVDNVLEKTSENLTGSRVVRAFTNELEEIKNFDNATNKLEKQQNKVGNLSFLMNPLTFIVVNLAIIVLIYSGALKVFDGLILQGVVIALYNYMSQILVELVKLANLIITMTKAIASGKRIGQIFELDSNINIVNTNTNTNTNPNNDYITFDNVSLTYSLSNEPSLENINFSIKKGSTLGIIGGTGSGKTSLIHLLLRFYEVSSGNLYLDNKLIQSYDPIYLRDKIGIVMQKASLFKGTIRDNILWGNNFATDEEILEALKNAQALDIVNSKGGLDAEVEQFGRNFSGGQKQRLSIARALIKKPEILILDDSSSALDYATDASLRKAIRNLSNNMTVIIISQRTTSIEYADNILVLEDGEQVGFGNHQELLETCQVYQEIYYSAVKGGNK